MLGALRTPALSPEAQAAVAYTQTAVLVEDERLRERINQGLAGLVFLASALREVGEILDGD